MFRKILIANRGEIAVRVIRACREMGIATVAVYSEADHETLHTQLADECICIGPGPVKDSYLHVTNLLSATVHSGAEAIHPGYGLLSEDEKFARICGQCHIKFIGPPPDVMQAMGNKLNARRTMIAAGVPVIPGSEDILRDAAHALAEAERVGYPVMVKASAGGGGRGIRRVNGPDELKNALRACKAEAGAAFGDDSLYLEKMMEHVRHIEVQVMADQEGHVVHLGERDCSLQYRRQKLVEESPSVFVDEVLRERMGAAAVAAARAVHYEGAGTIEFLVDDDQHFYFMEMNTRIQVEHPVTEMVTGTDIVQEQIRVAAGLPLSWRQQDIRITGHALECRVCANDPEKGFSPSSGRVKLVHVPGGPGVRFDSYLYNGCMVPAFYDAMVGKIIVHAPTRDMAIARMKGALSE